MATLLRDRAMMTVIVAHERNQTTKDKNFKALRRIKFDVMNPINGYGF